jgi:hypothetical protein
MGPFKVVKKFCFLDKRTVVRDFEQSFKVFDSIGKYEVRHQTMMFIGTTSQMSKSGDKH